MEVEGGLLRTSLVASRPGWSLDVLLTCCLTLAKSQLNEVKGERTLNKIPEIPSSSNFSETSLQLSLFPGLTHTLPCLWNALQTISFKTPIRHHPKC